MPYAFGSAAMTVNNPNKIKPVQRKKNMQVTRDKIPKDRRTMGEGEVSKNWQKLGFRSAMKYWLGIGYEAERERETWKHCS